MEFIMRALFVITAVAAAFAATGASAHPGSKILTAGGAEERTAMTPGMTYEDVNGVHIFRGAKPLEGGEPVAAAPEERIEIEIVIKREPWRHIRHMRTQGFYSGDPYPSDRYVQGIYSTGR